MRKVDIRERVKELDTQLRIGRAKRHQQADERVRLVQACRDSGDHVFVWMFPPGSGSVLVCEFCHLQQNAGEEQLRRNLVSG